MSYRVVAIDTLQRALEVIRSGSLKESLSGLNQCEEVGAAVRSLQLLGEASRALGNKPQALELYLRALAKDSQNLHSLCGVGEALEDLGRFSEAKTCYSKILTLERDCARAWSGLGYVCLQTGDSESAESALRRAWELDPGDIDIRNRLGLACLAGKRTQEAIGHFQACVLERPLFAPFWHNLASAQRAAGNLEAAQKACEGALAARSDAAGWTNMGVVFQENNDLAGALVCYKRALKLDPEFALARVNMGIVLLLEGQMETGWIQYEYRWLLEPKPKLRHGGSLAWRGCEDLSGKVILLHSDQGFGDAIQFLRYAEILNSKGARVHVEVPSVLVEIAKQTRGVESVVPLDHPAQTFDHHCPLLSLPLACRTTLESIPANIPYLRASREAKHKWDSLILPRARARIALCWRGNPLHANDHNRSASIRDLAPLLERKDCLFISVQLSPTSDESDVLRSCSSAVDVTSEIASFDDTAAILEKVDLVISVDSAVAHLAGALGKKTWMLLPFAPDWRWMLRRTDSPWYPTVRLFRQQVTGDWRSAVEAVCTHLDECLTDGSIGTSGVDA